MSFAPSTRPLEDRLAIEPGGRLALIGEPAPALAVWADHAVEHDADVVVVTCRSVEDVRTLVPAAWAARRPGGWCWVVYRKGDRSFTRTQLGEAVERLGLDITWFRQTALDATWSAIRFRHRSEFRTLSH